uniref:Gag protein n=1 Tax=Ascaris lumbricoides TaxID=6252 RepID=Q17051_ASCLU|nr:gag protein [Ascaris lumbricoides]
MVGRIPPTEDDVDITQESSFQITAFIKRRDCLHHCLKNVMRLISQIENKHEKWLELLDTLSDPRAAEAENKAYEDYAMQPDSFLYLCEQAKTIADQLNARISNITDVLKTLQSSVSSPTPLIAQVSSNLQAISAPSPPEPIGSHVALPQIQLRKFSGNPKEWTGFWETFNSAVGHLPKIQCLNYLLSLLEGPAATVAQGYAMSESSFDLVVTALKSNYGNPAVIIASLHTELQNLPSDNGSQLVATVQALERILRQLEQAGENLDSPLLVFIIEQKLSQRIKRRISEYKALDPEWNVEKLRAKLREFMTAELIYAQSHGRAQQVKAVSTPRQPQIKTSSLLAQQKQQKKPSKPCAFFGESHWNRDCPSYSTTEKRIQRVNKLQLCTKCLKRGHSLQDCKAMQHCYYCHNRNHNSLLCMERCKSQEKGKNGTDQPLSPEEVIAANMASGNKVLLFCKEVVVSNPQKANCRTKALMFFDSGSQKSYITTRLANRLRLNTTPQKLSISTFGDCAPQIIQSNRTVISVQLQNGTRKAVRVSTIKRITSNLEVIGDNIEAHFGDLKPSELPRKIRSPDILIGHDYFSDFIPLTGIKRLGNGYELIPTKVGYILSSKQAEKKEAAPAVVCIEKKNAR